MTVGSWIIVLVLAVLVGAIIFNMIRKKKKGKSTCGCGCSACAMKDACHSKKQ